MNRSSWALSSSKTSASWASSSAAKLEDDSSALVLVADEPTIADFTSAVEPMDATLIKTELNEHDVKSLREHLKANRKRRSS